MVARLGTRDTMKNTINALLAFAVAFAAAAADKPIAGVADNSFLIEEAYNQEAGVVQHLLTAAYDVTRLRGPDDKQWEIAFGEEWPLFSQRHQFSYAIPYLFLDSNHDHEEGLGDIAIEYRWQAFFYEESMTALAPKVALTLPTGRASHGLGEDTFGCELGLPFSTTLNDRTALHLNAGMIYYPQAASANDRDLVHYSTGASVIYAITPTLHAMLESLGTWEETVNRRGHKQYDFGAVLSPGVRKAFDYEWQDAQLVLGVGVPIRVGGHTPEWGVFLYMSFEHTFARHE
jgi:hypothetical protein